MSSVRRTTRRRSASACDSQREPAAQSVSTPLPTKEVSGIVIARVARVTESAVWVELPGRATPVQATLSTVTLTALSAGAAVAVAVVPSSPDVQAVLLGPILGAVPDAELPNEIVLEAKGKITLRCGKATLSLGADGNAALRGTNVTTRASATNRIRGGNVQIN
jgi:hypothetical protein